MWLVVDSPQLGRHARTAVTDADEVYFPAATPWELTPKQNLGKSEIGHGLTDQLIEDGYPELPITAERGEAAGRCRSTFATPSTE